MIRYLPYLVQHPRNPSVKIAQQLHLIVYHERSRRIVPAHWALLLTDGEDDDAKQGPKYHAVGSPFTGYNVEVQRHYNPAETNRLHSLVLLGSILLPPLNDGLADSHEQLAAMAHQIAAPGVSSTPLDPFAVSNYLISQVKRLR